LPFAQAPLHVSVDLACKPAFHTTQLGLFSSCCQRPCSSACATLPQAINASSTPKTFAIAQSPAKKLLSVSAKQLLCHQLPLSVSSRFGHRVSASKKARTYTALIDNAFPLALRLSACDLSAVVS
jgi:hypothetical protein